MNFMKLALTSALLAGFMASHAMAQGAIPQQQAEAEFRATPSDANAAAVPRSCGTVQTTGSVYVRYAQAVARRKCLEKSSVFFVTTAAMTTDENMRAKAIKTVPATEVEEEEAEEEEEKLWAEKSFLGFNWALGVGYSFGEGPQRVADAEVVNGIVRIKDDNTDQAVAILEVHHLFEGKNRFGWGPFASVQTGEGDTALGFGVGLEFGWRDADPKSAGGFLLGVGYSWTQGVKVLGDGIVANEPLPTGETEVRFKNRSAGALLVFVSRRFDLSGPNTK
jgi:hypothetical protein